MLQRSIDGVIDASVDVEWAVSVRDATGREVVCRNGDRALKTASVGKLLLLVEAARQCVDGDLSGATVLRRDPHLAVADSGLWQHLRIEELAIDDLCVLIASVSDNTATNVLLETVGVQRVGALAESLGLVHTALLDFVRDHRGPQHPPTLSTGSGSELSRLMSQLARRELVSPTVSERVNDWLATGVDLSMVGSAFGLDPLAHSLSDRNLALRNKTGSDPGLRADVGTIARAANMLSYAVIANWDAATEDPRDAVRSTMNAIGAILRRALDGE